MTVAPEPVRTPLWRPMVTALSKTGGASIASGLLSALGTKIVAALLGPDWLALLQTLQQLRDGALIVATANGRMALVQGASELEGVRRREYLRTVASLFAAGTLLVALAMLAAPGEFVRYSRLPHDSEGLLRWIAATVALLSVFVFLTAILNVMREIGRLALLQMVAPAAAAIAAWPVALAIRAGHPLAMGCLLVFPAAASVSAGVSALRGHDRELLGWVKGIGRVWTNEAARHFFSVSGAMLASGLAATVMLLAVRASITRQESLAATGQFDAAWNISMNHVTLILGSIQAYYLPLLSAARSPEERSRQIRGMMIVASLATAPVIVALAALKPAVVALLYSKAFVASPRFLRWTLIGDYLKVASWVLMTPMLAARDLGGFLSVDLLTQAVFWCAARLCSRVLAPSEGAALGFLISYAFCFAACFAHGYLRRGFRMGAAGSATFLSGLVFVVAVSASSWDLPSVDARAAAVWIAGSVAVSGGFGLYLRRREP
ncbi:MAG TPA: hypothetical protein VMT15_13840 [Bryobacteraceae bacterium]|nr:hypothetical protein [Bryobacteraceae bacterium]